MRACPNEGEPVSLRKLLPDARFLGADNIWAQSCSGDSRSVKRGDLFVALAGTQNDGHDHVAEAVSRGCSAILAERRITGVDLPVCYVPDTRTAYGHVCQALAGDPSHDLKVIGITGTNGKTTTTCLVSSILATAGYRVGMLGTLGGFDGEDCDDSSLTTPPADELAKWLSRMVKNDCSHAVLEVSSHALDQARLAGIRLHTACVTNVRRDHLDYHPSIQDYRATKSRLLKHISDDGLAVINADDYATAAYLPLITTPVLTIGMQGAAEIKGALLERHVSEQTFMLTAGGESIPVRTRMIGTHHIYNCLVAAATGLAHGIDLATVVRGLEAVEHVPGRLERIECGQPFSVFVDYAHTPDALTGSLKTLQDVAQGRLICVFGAGGDRDRKKRPLMGSAVEEGADLAIITNDNPRNESPEDIAGSLLEGFESPSRAKVLLDRKEAIRFALDEAQPGDCVLIAGKGHETHQVIGDERFEMDDRETAREWLYENKPYAEFMEK